MNYKMISMTHRYEMVKKPPRIKCSKCNFTKSFVEQNLWEAWAFIDEIEQHYSEHHAIEPTREHVIKFLKIVGEHRGKWSLIPALINYFDLKFFYWKNRGRPIIYNVELAKMINQMKDEGIITSEYKKRAYHYRLT